MISTRLKDGREVKVIFAHTDFTKKLQEFDPYAKWELGVPVFAVDVRNNKPSEFKEYTHSTVCAVVEGPRGSEVELARGESWCSREDNFCRAVGRELALKRAVENGGFSR